MGSADVHPAAAGTVPESVAVEVAYCPRPGECDRVALTLPAGSTLSDALAASGVLQRHALPAEGLRVGIWCRLKEPDTLLRDRDRIEIYRPLTVDPKEARRLRYKRHKDKLAEKAAASLAKKQPGQATAA